MASKASEETADRDRLVQNAIEFLRHPKVRDATENAKTEFLKKQGLTTEEIETAFKATRVENGAIVTKASPSSQGSSLLGSFLSKVVPRMCNRSRRLERRYNALMDALSIAQETQNDQTAKIDRLLAQCRLEFGRIRDEIRQQQQQHSDRLTELERAFAERQRETQMAISEMQEAMRDVLTQLQSTGRGMSPVSPMVDESDVETHTATEPASSSRMLPQAMPSLIEDGPSAHQVMQDPLPQERQRVQSENEKSDPNARHGAAGKLGTKGNPF